MFDNPDVMIAIIAAAGALVASGVSAVVSVISLSKNRRNNIEIEAFKAKWSKNVELKSVALEKIAEGMSRIQRIKDELYEIEMVALSRPKDATMQFGKSDLVGALEELRRTFRDSIGKVDQSDQVLIHDAKSLTHNFSSYLDDLSAGTTDTNKLKSELAATRSKLSEIQAQLSARRQALLVSIGYEE